MPDPIIKIKRSSVPGKIPTIASLPLGELALNTNDGKVYIQQDGVGIGSTVIVVNPWSVGLGSDTYNTFFTSGSVGIGTTSPTSKLHVVGDVNIVGVSTFTGNATLSNVILNGTISAGGTTGISGQYLKSTGIGVTWASFPTLRTGNVFTAGAAQTSFTVSYNVGFVDVYINGVRLTDSEFTGTSGTSIVLNESCFGGETVDILAYNTTSTGSGGGGGISTESQTLNDVLGLGNTSSLGMSVGVITATSFVGNLTGTATFATTAGIATNSQGLTGTPNISVGVITATSYNGSGSNLTGIVTYISAGSGISVNQNSGNVTITAVGSSEGSWTVSAGSGTYSFTVPANATYVMWVRGSIPSGICIWNATVSISNTNVPVIGNQYGWYYVDGNQLVLTAIPSQIIGTSGSISTSNPAVSNTNTFSFGITNNSGTNQTVFYGYKTI